MTTKERWQATFDTVPQLFCDALRAAPDALYCKGTLGELSYSEAAGAMIALSEKLGPDVKGRTVALVLPNSPAFLIAYFGVLFAGASPALVNYGHPDATIDKLLNGLDVATVLSDRDIAGIEATHFDDAAAHQLATAISADSLQSMSLASDIGAILFSGGTTGLPKQVPHSNAVLVSKIDSIASLSKRWCGLALQVNPHLTRPSKSWIFRPAQNKWVSVRLAKFELGGPT